MTTLDNNHHSTTTTTTTTTMSVQFSDDNHPSHILRILNEQRNTDSFCDVILRTSTGNETIHAHRCILAASCDYFTAFFRHRQTGNDVIEAILPGSSPDAINHVIGFIYEGVITISEDTVEEIVRLADFLGMSKVLEFCCSFMKQTLNDINCLKYKVLADYYSLETLKGDTRDYVLPRMSTLMRRDEALDIPVDALRHLLSDNGLNYVREVDVLQLVQSIIANQKEHNTGDKRDAYNLLDCIEFEYLPPESIERNVLSNPDTLDWLRARPDLLERVKDMVVDRSRGRNHVEGIICRGRAAKTGEEPQLMLYLVRDDLWKVLKQPCEESSRLETMVTHGGFLYSIRSRTEDMNGYMHPQTEIKFFNRLDFRSGTWTQLRSPRMVIGQTILVSLADSLLTVDRMGRVERYVELEDCWKEYCCEGFPGASSSTIFLLPMPLGRQLFVLRCYSAGYSFYCSSKSLAIYRLDQTRRSCDQLTQIEVNDLFYDNTEEVNFFGYSIAPGVISLKDELGQTRAVFDMCDLSWSTSPRRVPRPEFVRDVYGSAACADRVFFVARSGLDGGDNVFVMFDHVRRRFKLTQVPPFPVSGLLCHVTLPATSVELLTES